MILIAHRGNIDGKSDSENEPSYIDNAILQGYDVEIDLWHLNNKFYLGHDNAQYSIDFEWILNRKNSLWVHCKNIDAIFYLKMSKQEINYFWHQEDDITITSHGFFWTYPGKQLTKNSIAVMPEFINFKDIDIAYGICSDFVNKYKK